MSEKKYLDFEGLQAFKSNLLDYIKTNNNSSGYDSVINVNDYGLVNDGTTDNLTAFNTLYAAHPHDVLVFSGGTYCFSGQIDTYDTHILLINTTIKFTADHGYGFNMMGYNREDVIGTFDNLTTSDPNEFPTQGEFIKGINGHIDGNYTAGKSLINVGTGSYFEISGLTLKNIGASGQTSRSYGIYGTNDKRVGYAYERLVKDIKVINYDLTMSNTVGVGGLVDSYCDNLVTINMKVGIESKEVSTMYNNIHIWNYPWTTGASIADTVGIEGAFCGNNIYLDSVDFGFDLNWDGSAMVIANNIGWFINSEANNSNCTYQLFTNITEGTRFEVRGINIRSKMSSFSPTKFTQGIFSGQINDGIVVNNLPITWNYENKITANSPVLTGVPKAPNPATGADSTQIATTHFVTKSILDAVGGTTEVNDVKTYTVNIPLDPTGEFTYADDAAGMTPGSDDWDSLPLFRRIRPCVFKNGAVQYYLDKTNFNYKEDGTTASVLTGADGDVMIEIPGFAYKINQDDTQITISVTNDIETALTQGYTTNAFTYESTCDCGAYYYGTYLGSIDDNSQLRSISGVTPTGQTSYNTFAAKAINGRDDYYEVCSYQAFTAVLCLMLIKYATRDFYSSIGHGYCLESNSAPLTTGGTEEAGMSAYGSTADDLTHVKIFGIEDFWGNMWQITSDIHPFLTNEGTLGIEYGHVNRKTIDTGIAAQALTWGTSIDAIYGNNILGFYQKAMGTGSGVFPGGGGYGKLTNSANSVITVGGGFDSGTISSPFSTYTHSMTINTEPYIGARLGYNKIGTPAIDGTTKEIIKDVHLYSPNGTKYKITVDDNGILSAEIIS